MRFGAHLPLIDFDGTPFTPSTLPSYVDAARDSGFYAISANDHLVFQRPWLDGIVALSSVVERSGDLTLATTVALPVIRGPVALAKAAAALQILSGDRFVLGVGPGSSARTTTSSEFRSTNDGHGSTTACAASAPSWPSSAALEPHPRARPDLDRQLGLRGRAAAGRAPRGRLAGVGVQHDTGADRRRPGGAAHRVAGRGSRGASLPGRPGDDLDLPDRQQGRGPDAAGGAGGHAPAGPGPARRPGAHRRRRHLRGAARVATRTSGSTPPSSGRSATRSRSWSASAPRSSRSWADRPGHRREGVDHGLDGGRRIGVVGPGHPDPAHRSRCSDVPHLDARYRPGWRPGPGPPRPRGWRPRTPAARCSRPT